MATAKLEGPWKKLTLLSAVPYGTLLSTPYTYTLYPTGKIYPNWISTEWNTWVTAFCTKTNQICYKIRDNCITVHKVNCATIKGTVTSGTAYKTANDCTSINRRCNDLLIANKTKLSTMKRYTKPSNCISLATTTLIPTSLKSVNLKNTTNPKLR